MTLPTLHAFVEVWNEDQDLTTPDLHIGILDWLSNYIAEVSLIKKKEVTQKTN